MATKLVFISDIHGNIEAINTGSVGRPKDGDNRACYCIVELESDVDVKFIRVSYDVEKVAEEIEKTELLDEFAELLRTGKDIKDK